VGWAFWPLSGRMSGFREPYYCGFAKTVNSGFWQVFTFKSLISF
jgi:hypothetical protein